MKLRLRQLTVLGLFAALTGTAHAALTIGGFDVARADAFFNIASGSALSSMRSGINSAFAGTTYSSTNVLTGSYLSTIDVLIITTVGAQGGGPVVTLSANEQAALLDYVKGGGSALLITDNAGFNTGNVSFVAQFGLTPTAVVAGPAVPNAPVSITNSFHPVTNGLFGAIANYDVHFPGAYDSLGPNAVGLARASVPGNGTLDNKFVLAAISPGVLSPTSGGVVFVSDLNFLLDGEIDGNVQNLVSNAIQFATQPSVATVPEPASLTLWSLAAVAIGVSSRRRNKHLTTRQ